MIQVQAPSRLHFGLFNLSADTHWANCQGEPTIAARRFGGVGLMVRDPGLKLSAEPASDWSAEGPLAERACALARRMAGTFSGDQRYPQRILIESSAPEHSGLGTGTQLALAVGTTVATAYGLRDLPVAEIGRRLQRGERSALGIHGFKSGGFLVEAGKSEQTEIAPLIARVDFPSQWRVVLVLPGWAQGMHGGSERRAFVQLEQQPFPLAATDALCRLTLLGMLPALANRDIASFGEALYDFNRRVGELFATVQDGPYSHPRLVELVEFIREEGIHGVGQSSWGPTIFAVVGDSDHADRLTRQIRDCFGLQASEVIITEACNRGAVVTSL